MAATVPATANQFLDLAHKSGVLDAAAFAAEFPDADALPPDPSACASALIRAGLLTRYQAEQLLAGRSRGFRLGAYKILQPLGKGGMGAVFLGEHTDLKRQVAIKVLAADKATDRLAVERFHREGRAAAALNHPNIVRLYDISQANGMHYLALEYVDGSDLDSLLASRGRLPYAEAVEYVTQAAAGLQHAHEKGFVHRDIKPANLIVGPDGVLKILDMGLARSATSAADNLTGKLGGAGEAVGTADFVSPEQALADNVDARGDVYSLGATLYALLAGRTPFKGNTTQLLVQHQLAPVPPLPDALNIPDSDALDEVIATAMAKDPDDRFQSAAEFADALRPWMPGAVAPDTATMRASPTVRTRPRPAPEPESDAVKGKKLLALGLAGGGLLVLLAVVVVVVALSRREPEAAVKNTQLGESSALVPVDDKRTAAPSPPPPPPEMSERLMVGAGQIQEIAFSADGKKFVVAEWNGPLTLWEADPVRQVRSVPARQNASYKTCAFSPDGKYVVTSGWNTPILVVEWDTGHVVRDFAGHAQETWSVAVSPDGKELLSGGDDGQVTLRDFATGAWVRSFDMEAKRVWSVAFSPDGSKVVGGSGDGLRPADAFSVRVWETATGKQLNRFDGHTKDVRWVTFRPDGGAVASASFDGTVRQWTLADGKQAGVIMAHRLGYAERVLYRPGGKQLVTCGGPFGSGAGEQGALKIWNADKGDIAFAWAGTEGRDLVALAVSPKGDVVLAGGRAKILRRWKIPQR